MSTRNLGYGRRVRAATLRACACACGLAASAQVVVPYVPPQAARGTPLVSPCPLAPAAAVASPAGVDSDFFGRDALVVGKRLFVGSPGDDTLGDDVGAVHVYEQVGLAWQPLGALFPSPVLPGRHFGTSLDAAGGWLVVGARGSFEFGGTPGAVFVLAADADGTFVQVAELPGPPGPEQSGFGETVAVDGGRIAVGAPFEDTGVSLGGAVYVFEPDGAGEWQAAARLVAPVPNGGILGAALDLAGDVLVAGAPYIGAEFVFGNAFVFRRVDGTWSLEQELENPLPTGRDRFGASVALSGGRAFVGAPKDTPPNVGFVVIFGTTTRGDGASWTAEQLFTAPDFTPFDRFGQDIDVQGQRLIVGAPTQDGGNGAAYLFALGDAAPIPTCKLPRPRVVALSGFGSSVHLFGTLVLVGSPYDDVAAVDDGSLALYAVGVDPQPAGL